MARRRLKRELKQNIRNAFILVLVFVISSCVGLYLQRRENFVNIPINVTYNVVDTTKTYTASMIMVGDALMHTSVCKYYKTADGYDFSGLFINVKDTISKYDLAYYNQETILGGSEAGVTNYPQFNSPYEVGKAFVNVGFNLVSLANNHSLDRMYGYYYENSYYKAQGTNLIKNSLNFWNTYKDKVLYTGTAISSEERNELKIYEKNGITYAMLSYTTSTNGLPVPSGKDYLVNVYSAAKAKEDILKYRDKVDFLMVAMHWGQEYTHTPVSSQKTIATYLSNLGVDLIIGTHPHVVEPITYVNDTLVFYSLGNFVSSQIGIERLTGLMGSVTIKKTVYHGKTKITFEDIGGELIYTYKSKGYVVYPYSMLNNSILNNYDSYYTKYSKIVTSSLDNVTIKGL